MDRPSDGRAVSALYECAVHAMDAERTRLERPMHGGQAGHPASLCSRSASAAATAYIQYALHARNIFCPSLSKLSLRVFLINASVFSFIHQLTTWHCPHSAAAAAARLLLSASRSAVDRYLLLAANPQHVAAGWDRQTDGRATVTYSLLHSDSASMRLCQSSGFLPLMDGHMSPLSNAKSSSCYMLPPSVVVSIVTHFGVLLSLKCLVKSFFFSSGDWSSYRSLFLCLLPFSSLDSAGGIMFSRCPSVCLCVRTRERAVSDGSISVDL